MAGSAGSGAFVFGRGVQRFTFAPAVGPDRGVVPGNRDVVVDSTQGEDRPDLRGYANILARPGVPSEPVFLDADPFVASYAPQIRSELKEGRTVVQLSTPLGNPPSTCRRGCRGRRASRSTCGVSTT